MVKHSALSHALAATLFASGASANIDAPPAPPPAVPVVPTTTAPSPPPKGSTAKPAPPPVPSDGEPPAPPAPKPIAEIAALHHAPPASATAHAALHIAARIDFPNKIKRAVLVYRTPGDPTYREVAFLRATEEYVADVPGAAVDFPSISYAIEFEAEDGSRTAMYATRDAPHVVDVPGDFDDARENALLARLEGRRSVVSTSGELVSFGHTRSTMPDGSAKTVLDHWYRIEGSYTFRPLRTVMEFGVRAGVVRGTAPVPFAKEQADGASTKVNNNVGLNYGSPFVVFRATEDVHLEGNFLMSVTEVGFSTGVGGAVHLGDYLGTKLVLGFEHVAIFGTRGYSRLDLVRGRVRVSPTVEVTDMPHADRAGVRLLTELGLRLGQGFGLALRGGYQARDFSSGGLGGGVAISYAF